MTRRIDFSRKIPRFCGVMLVMAALTGCEGAPGMGFLKSKEKPAEQSAQLIDRDAEAPDVFQKTEAGLWDGRPSLGGVWVAHPDVTDPQRVVVRNTTNGKSVIGALFRRERELPGPRFQVSSDAATKLGMLAGAPVELNVTALVRDTTPDTTPGDSDIDMDDDTAEIAQPDSADAGDTTPTPEPARAASPLAKSHIQIGIFSVEANAESTAAQMRTAGLTPTVREQSANNKPFWRVLVGPAHSTSERATLMKQVKSAGFPDAYAVSD